MMEMGLAWRIYLIEENSGDSRFSPQISQYLNAITEHSLSVCCEGKKQTAQILAVAECSLFEVPIRPRCLQSCSSSQSKIALFALRDEEFFFAAVSAKLPR